MSAVHAPPWVNPATTAATPSGPDEEAALALLAALSHADVTALAPLLTPDAMYQNMPLPPAYGRDAVLEVLSGLFSVLSVDHIETFHLASRDGYVFTERVDVLSAPSTGRTYELPVTGVLRVVDGAVAEWRDYFDLRDVEEALEVRLRP